MGEIININRKRDKKTRGAPQAEHDLRPDEPEETELAKAFNGHWDKFLADCRDTHPDQMPRGVALDVFKAEMDEKYGSGWNDITDPELDVLEERGIDSSVEERLFEVTMLADELLMVARCQLPAKLLPYIRQQQLMGDYDMPEDLQAVLWHSRYERFLPELDNPFLLDQS